MVLVNNRWPLCFHLSNCISSSHTRLVHSTLTAMPPPELFQAVAAVSPVLLTGKPDEC